MPCHSEWSAALLKYLLVCVNNEQNCMKISGLQPPFPPAREETVCKWQGQVRCSTPTSRNTALAQVSPALVLTQDGWGGSRVASLEAVISSSPALSQGASSCPQTAIWGDRHRWDQKVTSLLKKNSPDPRRLWCKTRHLSQRQGPSPGLQAAQPPATDGLIFGGQRVERWGWNPGPCMC